MRSKKRVRGVAGVPAAVTLPAPFLQSRAIELRIDFSSIR